MFDFKIFLILAPIWLGVVIITLWLAFSLPTAKKTVERLLEKGCDSQDTALSLKELGVGRAAALLLGRGSSLRRVVDAEGERSRRAGAADVSEDRRFFIRPENAEKAKTMYCRPRSGFAQALVMLVIFTAAFFALWILASLIFDTTDLKLPFTF